jgi:hypothetical protein
MLNRTHPQTAGKQVVESNSIFLPPIDFIVSGNHFVEGKTLA